MTLDYSVKVQIKITILDYIKEILGYFENVEPKSRGTKSSTDHLNLVVVDEDCEKLSKEKCETFHKLTAKMLFATKILRPVTGIVISYLPTTAISPYQSD